MVRDTPFVVARTSIVADDLEKEAERSEHHIAIRQSISMKPLRTDKVQEFIKYNNLKKPLDAEKWLNTYLYHFKTFER